MELATLSKTKTSSCSQQGSGGIKEASPGIRPLPSVQVRAEGGSKVHALASSLIRNKVCLFGIRRPAPAVHVQQLAQCLFSVHTDTVVPTARGRGGESGVRAPGLIIPPFGGA